jgi:RNA polymerase sigma-70 factor (ECF subfamily)
MVMTLAYPTTIPGPALVWPGAMAADAVAELAIVRAYEEDRGALVGHLLALTRDRDVAEEIAQEAFARLVREVRLGRVPENIVAWLHRVGANLVTSRGRHQQVADRKKTALVSRDLADSAESAALRREDCRELRAALDRLALTQRQTLLLAAAGLSGQEIGTRLGRSDGAARTLLCRARRRLREELALLDGTVARAA